MSSGLKTMPGSEPMLPSGHEHLSFRSVGTGSWAASLDSFPRPNMRAAPIWNLRQQEYRFQLRPPLLVRVYQDEGFFFAENETLRLVGTGVTPEEALADFCLHLLHFHQYYRKMPARCLTGEARQLKKCFQRLHLVRMP